jgi:hypothetical protein
MGWQDVAVWIVVAGAVFFLVGRNVNLRRRRKQPAQTFVPLSSLRRPGGTAAAAPPSDDPACH